MYIDNGALIIAGSILIVAIAFLWMWYLAEKRRQQRFELQRIKHKKK